MRTEYEWMLRNLGGTYTVDLRRDTFQSDAMYPESEYLEGHEFDNYITAKEFFLSRGEELKKRRYRTLNWTDDHARDDEMRHMRVKFAPKVYAERGRKEPYIKAIKDTLEGETSVTTGKIPEHYKYIPNDVLITAALELQEIDKALMRLGVPFAEAHYDYKSPAYQQKKRWGDITGTLSRLGRQKLAIAKGYKRADKEKYAATYRDTMLLLNPTRKGLAYPPFYPFVRRFDSENFYHFGGGPFFTNYTVHRSRAEAMAAYVKKLGYRYRIVKDGKDFHVYRGPPRKV